MVTSAGCIGETGRRQCAVRWCSDPQDRTFASLGKIQQEIVKFVKTHPSCTQTAIVEGIGKSKQQINEAVNRLREMGIIKLVEGKKLICLYT
jgi:predicted transcriptional regulator